LDKKKFRQKLNHYFVHNFQIGNILKIRNKKKITKEKTKLIKIIKKIFLIISLFLYFYTMYYNSNVILIILKSEYIIYIIYILFYILLKNNFLFIYLVLR